MSIDVAPYTPGVKQTIRVTVQHPEAVRWGFELTARPVSDQTKQAGTFSTSDVVRVRCDTTPAADAPCNGAVEFPEHRLAPVTAAGAGFTFSVDWTPPTTDVGDIVFFAAGNAADGSGTNGGDRVYTTSKVALPAAECSLTAKATVQAVVNAASFQPGLAPNSLISIFGQGFVAPGVKRLAQPIDFVNKIYPKQLACLAVEVDGQRVPITYVQQDQINAQAPTGSDAGPVTVRVILNAAGPAPLASDPFTVQLQKQSPAFFMFNGQSVAALFGGTPNIVANPTVIASGKSAKPGDIVSLFATGCGLTDPVWQAGELPSAMANLPATFSISIGAITLAASDLLYAGLSPGSISGLYQFNVRIPDSAPDGELAVVLQAGGVASQNGATIPVKR